MRDQLRIVRRENKTRAQILLHPAHQFDDRRARVAIEVGGRLVGEYELRLLHQGAGDRHSLLLPPAQLVWALSLLIGEPHGFKHC